MEGKIVSFRRSIKRQQKYQMIDKAISLLNKKVTWKSPAGKEIHGVVTNTHGNSGALRVQFEKGLPGQSVGKIVSFS